MKITIEVTDSQELEKVLAALQMLKSDLNEYNVERNSSITKGDKSIDPTGLFGIWKDNPRTLTEIRKQSWERIIYSFRKLSTGLRVAARRVWALMVGKQCYEYGNGGQGVYPYSNLNTSAVGGQPFL